MMMKTTGTAHGARWSAVRLQLLLLALLLGPDGVAAGDANEDLGELKRILEGLDEGLPVEIMYLEYPLANIGTQEEDWSAYHSGIALVLEDSRAWTIDYRPRDPEHLMNFIRPHVKYTGQWPFWDVEIDWRNEAYIGWSDEVDERFTNSTLIGHCTVKELLPLVEFTKGFQKKHHMFQPISLVQNLNQTIISSTTCHDYVQNAINVLFKHGATFLQKKESMVFRDAVLVFSDKDPKVIDHTSLSGFLSILVYFRYFSYFVPAINRNFIHARAYLNEGNRQNVPFMLHSDGTYYQIFLRYPYIDYCYTTIHAPKKGAETKDLTDRFRHCKFTKAKFPSAQEGSEKLSKPLAQAFSSHLGWIRESAILLIPAALNVSPSLGQAFSIALGAIAVLMTIGAMRIHFVVLKRCFGRHCTPTTYLFAVGIISAMGGYFLHPLMRPMVDREPNDLRNWGCRGPLVNTPDPPPFSGVYSINGGGLFVSVDLSFISDVQYYETGEDESGKGSAWLPLDGPALTAIHNAAPMNDRGVRSLLPSFDGSLLLRLLQVLRAGYVIKFDRSHQRVDMYLSLVQSHQMLGVEESGEFWQWVFGFAGILNLKSTSSKNEFELSGPCERNFCKNLKIQLQMVMDKNRKIQDKAMSQFDKSKADLMTVGLAFA